jgi:hypothetical protein
MWIEGIGGDLGGFLLVGDLIPFNRFSFPLVLSESE